MLGFQRKTAFKATFWNRRQSIFRLLATEAPARDSKVWGIDNIHTGYTTLDERFTGNVLRLSSVTGNLNRPIAYDQDSCSAYTRPKECKNVDAFAANVSLTTSFPGFIREDGRLDVQLRSLSPSATTNYVVFISGSEFGSEPKSRSLSMQSERVTHLHIETIHKNPMDTLRVSTD